MAGGRMPKLIRGRKPPDPSKSVGENVVSSSQIDGRKSTEQTTEKESLIMSEAEGTPLGMPKKEDATVSVTPEAPSKETSERALKGKDQYSKNGVEESKDLASSITVNEESGVEEKEKRANQDFVKEKRSLKCLAGLIFMCSNETKNDCFKYRVFGFPEAKKNVVAQVRKGAKLFLFDVDKRILYGVYKATSEGGINLVEEAFKNSCRKFPAQVRFQIHKDCMPLEENVFKQAIQANCFKGGKFKCELNDDQVNKLLRLFRPLDFRGLPSPNPGKEVKRKSTYKSNPPQGYVRIPIDVVSPLSQAHLHHGREQLNLRQYTHAREDFNMPLSYTRDDMSSVYARDVVCVPSSSYGREDVRVPSFSYAREDLVHVPSLAYARENDHMPVSSLYARENVLVPSSSYAREDILLPLSSSYERVDVRLPSASNAREDARLPYARVDVRLPSLSYAREAVHLPLSSSYARVDVGFPDSSYARDNVHVSEVRAEVEALALYRERLQQRQQQDARLESLERTTSYSFDPMRLEGAVSHRRYMDDDAYADQQMFAIPRRPSIQDQHFYRDIEYEREIPSRGYGDSLHGISGPVPYDPAPSFFHRRSYR